MNIITTILLMSTGYNPLVDRFDQFLGNYNKNYNNTEYNRRLDIYTENMNRADSHNSKGKSWSLGETYYADWSRDEFSDMFGSYNNYYTTAGVGSDEIAYTNSVDWVDQGKVSSVKNQGRCGSCWAFSATGAVESAYAIDSGNLLNLSEQQIIDCDVMDHGCNGGDMDNAFAYVEENGLCMLDSYKYIGSQDPSCRKCNAKVYITGYKNVDSCNDKALDEALQRQPVSIAIEADHVSFQLYTGGVFNGSCGTNLDHGVLLVGTGKTNEGLLYWKVKNSWGLNWGENGYIRILRDNSASGVCGIKMQPSYPVV